MKIKDIEFTNFAKYDKVAVSLDPNVTYYIGMNGAGKTTLGLNGIQFIMQGIAEKSTEGKVPLIGERFRFIGPKGATAKGVMTLYDEVKGFEVKVIRKLTKTGTELSFVGPEGMVLDQQWLNDLFNIFLIAPKRFCELSPKEQTKALGIDTKPYDDATAALKAEYTSFNAVYRSYGELVEPEKADKVDVEALQAQKEVIKKKLNQLYTDNKLANKATETAHKLACEKVDESANSFNKEQDELFVKISAATKAFNELFLLGYQGNEVEEFIASLGKCQEKKDAKKLYPVAPTVMAVMPADYQPAAGELVIINEMPDDKEMQDIDKLIADAAETNRKALLYTQWEESVKKKEAQKAELDANTKKQKDKDAERVAYVKAFKFPFSNITVDEDGQLLMAGQDKVFKPIKEPYFSTGEILKIVPILLSTANPELKYVFIQGFNDLDEDNWPQLEKYLTDKGFQLVVEMVGKAPIADKNCILLKDNIVVESYDAEKAPELV